MIFFKVLWQISLKFQDMIEDHQSKSKFEVQEFRSKVKVTKNIKNTLLIITSFIIELSTWNQRHIVPWRNTFHVLGLWFDVTSSEVRQNDVTRWRHFPTFDFGRFYHSILLDCRQGGHTLNLTSIGLIVVTSGTFLNDVFKCARQKSSGGEGMRSTSARSSFTLYCRVGVKLAVTFLAFTVEAQRPFPLL